MPETLEDHEHVTALLGGPLGWHTVLHEREVTSTNDVALEAVRQGIPPGYVIVADHQTKGRGRNGRHWEDASAPGDARSLTASCIVGLPPANAGLVPLAAGVAVADALRRAAVSPMLKWPNDVLARVEAGAFAKCAGVLVERHDVPLTTGDAAEVLIVGIGIDLDWRDVNRDGEAAAWISVAEVTGTTVDRGVVLADVLRGLAVWLRSLPTEPLRLLVTYRDACATIGQQVRVDFPNGTAIEGLATDLDREGHLVVDTDSGAVAITAGDVIHLRPSW